MYELFVGDITPELANTAKKHNANAFLLDTSNYKFANGTVYTSIADIGLEKFFDVCKNAEKIYYVPPTKWSDNNTGVGGQQHWTEYLLCYFSQTIPVINYTPPKKNYFLPVDLQSGTSKSLSEIHKRRLQPGPLDRRKTEGVQIWVAGCSITQGEGVDLNDTYKVKISNSLNLPYSDLSVAGSGIPWAANQILQSDIKKDDYVFWGLTTYNRTILIDPEKQTTVHLRATNIEKYKKFNHIISPDYIDSDTHIYQCINSIRNVYNFCKKIQAKLVILGVMPDLDLVWPSIDIPCFQQAVTFPDHFVDFGTDGYHPGPEQHTKFAETFINIANNLYG